MAIHTNEDVASRVRGLAAERRSTQQQLAAALNISEMAISRRINGRTPFTPEELITLARHFRVNVAYFFDTPALAEGGDAA